MTFCLQELCQRHHNHNCCYLQEWLFFFLDNTLYLTLGTCYLQVVYVLYFNLSSVLYLTAIFEGYCKLNISSIYDAQGHQSKGFATNSTLSWDYTAPAVTQMCCSSFFTGWLAKCSLRDLVYSCDSGYSASASSTNFSLSLLLYMQMCKSLSVHLRMPKFYSYNLHLGVQKCDELGKLRLYIILWVHCLTLSSRWLQIGDCLSIDLSYNWAAI